ncbi:MAG: hypothetical protein ACOYMR_15330 [Ilumatobacteraceae bacterium]
MMHRDVELAELSLQNQATWKVLDFAVRSRDASTRLHGVALSILPFAAAAVGTHALLIYAGVGMLFLSFVSVNSFTSINAMRLLQYRLAVEEGRSRASLRGGVAVHSPELDVAHPPALAKQSDPMGTVTRSARWVAAADLGAVWPLFAAGLVARYGRGRPVLTGALVTSALLAAALFVATWLVWSRRHVEREERSLADDLTRHLRERA